MSCSDMIIAFSGFRDEGLKSQIEEAGGKVTASLTKTSTHLLVKKDGKSSKKIDEAKEKDIVIIDLDEFLEEHNFHKTSKASKKKGHDEAELDKGNHSDNEHEHEKEESAKSNKQLSDMEILAKIMHTLTTKDKKSDAVNALEMLKSRINNI